MKKFIKYIFSLLVIFSFSLLNADMVDTSTKTNLINDLSKIYSDFDSTDRKIYTTNKFNCNTTGCSTSNFNNIGILSLYEYNKVGGDDSYLYNMNTFFVLNGTNVEVLNGSGDNSYVRPSVHLVPDTKVTGSGTYDDPWKIYDMIYYNYNISVSGGSVNPSNGQVLEGNTLTITLTPDSSHTTNGATTTCSNGVINGNILTISNVQSDLDCQVVFPIKKYYISVSSSTGSVSPSSVVVNHGNSVTLSLTPSTGYTAVGATTTCTNATISGRSLIIRNVSQNMNCTVTFSKSVFAYNITASGGTITPSSGSIGSGQNLIIQLTPDLIHKIKGVTTTCSNSTITGNVLTISNVKSALNCSVTFPDIYLPGSLAHKLMNNNSDIREREGFIMNTYTEATDGIMFKASSSDEGQYTEDVDGDGMGEDSYYFAGNMTKNWVKFGGYYWRVIRINEDGSVRIIYSGTSPSTTAGYIGTSVYNSNQSSYLYTGYMYGSGTTLATQRNNTYSTTIKGVVDKWYKNNLKTSYDKYISKTAIYCSDRAIGETTSNSQRSVIWSRLNNENGRPSYRCGTLKNGSLLEETQSVADKFSASTTGGGNGKLTYPVALITMDEAVFSGIIPGVYANKDNGSDQTWLYRNSNGGSITGSYSWWTMSPGMYSQFASDFLIYGSEGPGRSAMANLNSTVTYVVRPVISLKYCTQYSSGDGSSSNPYTVSVSTSCSSALN